MSLAFEWNNNTDGGRRIEELGFVHRDMAYVLPVSDPQELIGSDRRSPEVEDGSVSLSSSSSSSIGKNSDNGSGSDDEEVQSEFKGGPLDCLDSLEEVLPIKKSISNFYSGKSKSFTSLCDAASCPTIQDITKPENAYTRKHKNLLAFNNSWGRNRNNISRNRNGGISKRPTNSRSMLVLDASCSESNSGETSNSNSSYGCCRPPLPSHARRNVIIEPSPSPPTDRFSSWRSFSLSDLQGAAAAAAAEVTNPSSTGLWINNPDE